MLAFAIAHQSAILATLAALVALGRAVEHRYGDALAHRFPRAAAFAAAIAHLSPDLVSAARVILRAWRPGLFGVLTLMLIGCTGEQGIAAWSAIQKVMLGVQAGCTVAAPIADAVRATDGTKIPTIGDGLRIGGAAVQGIVNASSGGSARP